MEILTIVLFILIGIMGFIEVFFDKKGKVYTIHKFACIYILIFWSIVPLAQYIAKRFPWGVTITYINALQSNLLILLFVISYIIFYKIFFKKSYKNNYNKNNLPIIKFRINESGILLLLTFQLTIFIYFYIIFGGFVFVRGGLSLSNISDVRAIILIIDRVFRSFTTFAMILILINYKNNKTRRCLIYLIISFLLLFFTNFPLTTARYMAGAFYIGVLFVIKPNFRLKSIPYICLLFLFLIIYPAASILRSELTLSGYKIDLFNTELFYSGNFDNYSTLSMTIDYVKQNGITYGHQLLGVLLFFVPRSVWVNKPIGSGAFVAESSGMSFTNISSPIIAEGYINFGVFGILLFAIILAYFVARFDYKFYQYGKMRFIKLLYPVALGMIFFILRGDLLSSFAFLIGFSFAAFLMYMLINRQIKYLISD